MKLSRAWVGGFGFASLAGVLVLAACSDDGGGGGGGNNNNTAGSVGTTGGMVGTAGTPSFGGSPASGGAPSGGDTATGGTPAQPGAGTGGGGDPTAGSGNTAGAEGFACAGKAATCAVVTDFPKADVQVFGKGDFGGGFSVFGAGLMLDTTTTDALHVTGTVNNYGHGFNIWFNVCSSLAGFTGVSFKLGGTAGTDNLINFEFQTNSNYPWQPRPMDKKGACTATDAENPWNECVPPAKNGIMIPATPAEVTITWADLTGGAPVAWDPTTGPNEVVGIQFQFPWSGTATEYTVDVTLDDVTFTGNAAVTEACPVIGAGGSGGTGGAGGGGNDGGTGGVGGDGGNGGAGGGGTGGTGDTGGTGGSGGFAGTAGTAGAAAGSSP